MRGHEVEIEVIVECENKQMSKGPSGSFEKIFFHDNLNRANIAIYESIPVPEEPPPNPFAFSFAFSFATPFASQDARLVWFAIDCLDNCHYLISSWSRLKFKHMLFRQ